MSNYLLLDGASGAYASTPDHADFSVTDLDIQALVAPDDWSRAADEQAVCGKWLGTDKSWIARISTTGVMDLLWSEDGTTTDHQITLGDLTSVTTDGEKWWVRWTLDVSTGTVETFEGGNGDTPSWNSLGTDSTAGATSIFDSAQEVGVGAYGSSGSQDRLDGKVFQVIIKDGIGGTTVGHFNADDFNVGDGDTDTAVGAAGKTWTINGTNSEIFSEGPVFPAAPTNLTATAVSTSQINLSWDAVSGAGGYDIERDGSVIVSDQAGTTYNDTGLNTGQSYDYRVRAVS